MLTNAAEERNGPVAVAATDKVVQVSNVGIDCHGLQQRSVRDRKKKGHDVSCKLYLAILVREVCFHDLLNIAKPEIFVIGKVLQASISVYFLETRTFPLPLPVAASDSYQRHSRFRVLPPKCLQQSDYHS